MSAKKEIKRDANMDLMRITAMFLVMMHHVNYWGIAQEYAPLESYSELQIIGYTLMKSITMICVNMFILISGWYGIKPNLRKLFGLFFQIWFFSISSYLLFVFLYEDIHFSLAKFIHYLFFSDYWFVIAYLMLYLMSPILNAFVESAKKKQLQIVIVAYYTFQFIFGWFDRSPYFDHGSSPLVFIGLYLVARYIRVYKDWFDTITIRQIIICYSSLLVITVLLCSVLGIIGEYSWVCILMQNSSPLTVFLAILVLLIFSKLKLNSNKTITTISTSSFAVYLFHDSTCFYEKIFYPTGCWIYCNFSFIISLMLLLIFLSTIYMISIILDLLRIKLWMKVVNFTLPSKR